MVALTRNFSNPPMNTIGLQENKGFFHAIQTKEKESYFQKSRILNYPKPIENPSIKCHW